MINVPRPAPFVLVSTNHGTMIVNRNDYMLYADGSGIGVGYQLLHSSSFDASEVGFVLELLKRRLAHFGAGVVAVDCGANLGVHTVEWGRLMHGWGEVLAFEAQEKIFYALAGNIILNNCLNVSARHCAVGAQTGSLRIAEPNYLVPSSYGSFELRQSERSEFIGQKIDLGKTKSVPMISIDSLELQRLDLLKVDVEGMEEEVLAGAERSLSAHRPNIIMEVIKSDKAKILAFLEERGYTCFSMGINVLAIHQHDPVLLKIKLENNVLSLA